MNARAMLAWLGGAALLVAVTFLLDDYTADLFRKMLLTATLALSFNFLFGIAGQLAFSHVAFYGIGAYAIVIFAYQLGWPLPLAFLGALGVGLVLALSVAVPSLRLEGFFLGLASLAFAQIFTVVMVQGGELTGAADGISGYASPVILGIRFGGQNYLFAVIGLFLGTLVPCHPRQSRSRRRDGHQCRAHQDHRLRAEQHARDDRRHVLRLC
jgi:branched-chain amino acid transport system permease protein